MVSKIYENFITELKRTGTVPHTKLRTEEEIVMEVKKQILGQHAIKKITFFELNFEELYKNATKERKLALSEYTKQFRAACNTIRKTDFSGNEETPNLNNLLQGIPDLASLAQMAGIDANYIAGIKQLQNILSKLNLSAVDFTVIPKVIAMFEKLASETFQESDVDTNFLPWIRRMVNHPETEKIFEVADFANLIKQIRNIEVPKSQQ
jgi:hypothetical protein